MPNRIIKESICTSASIDGLAWFDEVFFYRLIVNCDDYGRFDARPAVLRSRLFPLKEVTAQQVEAALSKLIAAGMARVYEHKHQPYLQLESWGKHQSVRNKRSKYPEPPALASNCNQTHANVPVIQSESVSESESNPNSGGCGSNAHDEPNAFTATAPPPLPTVESYIADKLATPVNGAMVDDLNDFEAQGLELEAVRYAVDIALNAGSPTWKFTRGVIQNWLRQGVTTLDGARAAQKQHDDAKGAKARAAPGRVSQPALSKAEQFMELARRYEIDES